MNVKKSLVWLMALCSLCTLMTLSAQAVNPFDPGPFDTVNPFDPGPFDNEEVNDQEGERIPS